MQALAALVLVLPVTAGEDVSVAGEDVSVAGQHVPDEVRLTLSQGVLRQVERTGLSTTTDESAEASWMLRSEVRRVGDRLRLEVAAVDIAGKTPTRRAALVGDLATLVEGLAALVQSALEPLLFSGEGRLNLRANVAEAQVFVDDEARGELLLGASLALTTTAGVRSIRVEAADCTTVERKVRVRRGEEVVLEVEMEAVPGRVDALREEAEAQQVTGAAIAGAGAVLLGLGVASGLGAELLRTELIPQVRIVDEGAVKNLVSPQAFVLIVGMRIAAVVLGGAGSLAAASALPVLWTARSPEAVCREPR